MIPVIGELTPTVSKEIALQWKNILGFQQILKHKKKRSNKKTAINVIPKSCTETVVRWLQIVTSVALQENKM